MKKGYIPNGPSNNGRNPKRQPDLNIALGKDEGKYVGTLFPFRANKQPDFPLKDFDDKYLNDDLNLSAEKLYKKLSGLNNRDDLPQILISPKRDALAHRGYLALNAIFEEKTIEDIEERVAEAKLKLKEPEFPFVEINTNDFFIPWEWLYNNHVDDLHKPIDLETVVNPFWGFNRIISRQKLPRSGAEEEVSPPAMPQICDLEFPIKVGLIVDESLSFACKEREWLKDKAIKEPTCLVVEELTGLDSGNYVEEVNKFLSRADLDILHLACDSKYADENPLWSHFSLGLENKDDVYQLHYLHDKPQITEIKYPIVFFNACSTGIRNPSDTYNFIGEFRKRGVQNIIAIESTMSSRVAEQFAQYFYEYLIAQYTVGDSIQNARHALLRNGSSPYDIVVLFYSLYANAGLYFRTPE